MPTYHPTGRVLAVLELLQARPQISGAEIARRLEVDARTVRRYIALLQDLGIPIESQPGRGGGYALRAGFRMPPLMLTEDEATALTLGLLSARQLGVAEIAPAVEGALAKIERLLSEPARARVAALRGGLTLDIPASEAPVSARLLSEVSLAVREGRRVRVRYRSARGESARELAPLGVVAHAGRWYMVADCALRGDRRVFRLDRVLAAEPLEARFTPDPQLDCLGFLLRSIAEIPDRWDVLVRLDMPLEQAQAGLPPALAIVEQRPDGVWMRASIHRLDIIARALAGLGCELSVERPPELRAELAELAGRLARAAV